MANAPAVLNNGPRSYQADTLQPFFQAPQELGSGHFGRVYLYQNGDQQRVAIKRVQLTVESQADRAELQHSVPLELNNHFIMNHPHLVKMLDVFVLDGFLNIVLEYVADGNLLQRANALFGVQPPVDMEVQARPYFQQLMVVLDYMHHKGVAHRDIKLDNTLLQGPLVLFPPPAGQAMASIKVADLGLSRVTAPDEMAGTRVGTREYKAPEILGGFLYNTAKVDVWAAGVLLYSMTRRRYPFRDVEERLARKHRVPLDKVTDAQLYGGIQEIMPQLMNDLQGLCGGLLTGMLQFNPAQRFTVQQVINHPWFQTHLDPALLQLRDQCLPLASPCALTPEELHDVLDQSLAVLQQ